MAPATGLVSLIFFFLWDFLCVSGDSGEEEKDKETDKDKDKHKHKHKHKDKMDYEEGGLQSSLREKWGC